MGYIDLDLMKNILGIDGNGLDELVQFYIDSSTQTIINIIGRDISEKTITVYAKGNDSNFLYVDYKPISSVTEVLYNDEDITSDVNVVEEDRALYYSKGFKKGFDYVVKQSQYDEGSYDRKETKLNVSVSGTFGYATIPTDVQNVCAVMVQNYYVSSGISPQVKKEVLETDFGKNQKDYFNIIKKDDLSAENRAILIKYR